MWYLLATFIGILNSSVSLNNENFSVCCLECHCNVTISGVCFLPFSEDCSGGSCIFLNFRNETSIVELEISIEHRPNSTNSTEGTPGSETVKLEISEIDTTEYVLLETRYIQVSDLNRTSYLTRSSTARICASYTAELPHYIMKFAFKEFEYRRIKLEIENPLGAAGNISGENVPNSVTLYQLPVDPERKWKGIEIRIHDLEIDAEKGEYLLIGAGSSDDFPPRFLTHITNFSSFYVANASAFIEIVSSVRKQKPFKILWERKDAEIVPTMNPMDILNSVLICFYNRTEAEKEFNKENNDEVFPVFREKFAESAKKYLKGNKLRDVACLDMSSIKLIGPPTVVKSLNALSVLVIIECDGKVFRYQELYNIASYFEDHDSNETLGYKVGICPDVHQSQPYKDTWIIYAIVPLFSLLILIVWAWRNNIFAQKCKLEKEETVTFNLEPKSAPVQPNPYQTTIPKVRLDDGQGRRRTLIQGSVRNDDRRNSDADEERMVEMSAMPSTSQDADAADTLTRVLSNRKAKRRPSIQSLISVNEENECKEKFIVQKVEGEESEHLYDSVSSGKQMNETKL